jgi:hypothetical protein
MIKTYKPSNFNTKFNSPLAAYVYDKLGNGIDPDMECQSPSQSLLLIGKRVLHEDSQGFVTLACFNNFDEAQDAFESRMFPDEHDATICEISGLYLVTLDGASVGTVFCDRVAAEFALAEAMVAAGTFPNAWLINDRGNYFGINEVMRAYHDAYDDKMN